MDLQKNPPYSPLSFNNKPNKLLSAKLNKVLNTSVADDTRIKSALSALSDIQHVDQADIRHNLRGTIERKDIEANRLFLDALKRVMEPLERLEIETQAMTHTCKDMQDKLDTTQAKTSMMMEQASLLEEQRSACTTQLLISERFLDVFTPSEEEIRLLTSSSPINNTFFEALNHLEHISSNCQLLLMTQYQKAGQHIMETLGAYQEAAYSKLYRWTQYESRSSFGNDSIDVSSLMVKALGALQHRPVLLQTILDELSAARRDAVSRAFIDALVRGGPHGTPRPIELQAHDSQRYIGDMLAWVHQACASEKEILESLFASSASASASASSLSVLPGSVPPSFLLPSAKDIVADLLDCAMEGTCRPLKSRMEQALVQPSPLMSYRIANLIQFYAITMSKLVRKDAMLAKTLYEITDMAYKSFLNIIRTQEERLAHSTEPPSRDLSVSLLVRDMALQLKEILASYDSSLIVSVSKEETYTTFDFGEILDAIINPLLRMCEQSVTSMNSVDSTIYRVNCMHYLQSMMLPFDFTQAKRDTLHSQINNHLDSLATEQYKELLQQSGLAKIEEALVNKPPEVALSSLPRMDYISLQKTVSQLDSFLMRISTDHSPSLRRLSTAYYTRKVQENAIRLLLETYRRISEAVQDPQNEYSDSHNILPRTVEEMEAIFSFTL
ncbi:oligomeric Golgi complex subunit 6 [Spinellus fusiger]|nr:oligomeric Golgi complex subunit 6 [Spinellus fusiger]